MKYLLVLLLAPLIVSCEFEGTIYNFHTVDEGRLYRVNQLSKKEQWLEHFEKYGIKTLVNLRGVPRKDEDWYREETAAAEEAGVEHISIRMSAKRLPHAKDLRKLIEVYQTAEMPILIHCQGGADRAGEASAIYVMEFMGKSKKEALKQLTFKYLHIKQRYPAKRYFIDKVWQGLEWAKTEYDPCSGEYKHYNASNPVCSGEAEDEDLAKEEDS